MRFTRTLLVAAMVGSFEPAKDDGYGILPTAAGNQQKQISAEGQADSATFPSQGYRPSVEREILPTTGKALSLKHISMAEEGELTIAVEESGCFSGESASISIRWTGETAELLVGHANLYRTKIDPLPLTSPSMARRLVHEIADILEPDSGEHICTTLFEAQILWQAGPVQAEEHFTDECGTGPAARDHGRAERLFEIVRAVVSGRDLSQIRWAAL